MRKLIFAATPKPEPFSYRARMAVKNLTPRGQSFDSLVAITNRDAPTVMTRTTLFEKERKA